MKPRRLTPAPGRLLVGVDLATPTTVTVGMGSAPGGTATARIGTGTIGDTGFAAVLARPGLSNLSVITETTGGLDQITKT